MGDETPQVIMYCRSWCGDCRRARAWLQEHDIPYIEIDVDDDSDARVESRRHTTKAGSTRPPSRSATDTCVDFRPEKLKELLGIE